MSANVGNVVDIPVWRTKGGPREYLMDAGLGIAHDFVREVDRDAKHDEENMPSYSLKCRLVLIPDPGPVV